MQVVVNGIKQPLIPVLFQNLENNMEKFTGSTDAIETSQKMRVSKANAHDIYSNTLQQANCASWYL